MAIGGIEIVAEIVDCLECGCRFVSVRQEGVFENCPQCNSENTIDVESEDIETGEIELLEEFAAAPHLPTEWKTWH
jgi:Zn finger protein HypA/HybF involved in hydrogenase expression